MLCATCSSILEYQFRSIERKTRFPHHASASSLRSSVSQGCYVCRAFANELFDSTQEADWNQDLTGLSTRCSLSKRAETVLSVTVRNAYTMMIGLAEDTELFGPAHRQGNFTIFVLQPSSGRAFRGCFGRASCGGLTPRRGRIQMWKSASAGHRRRPRYQTSAGTSPLAGSQIVGNTINGVGSTTKPGDSGLRAFSTWTREGMAPDRTSFV